MPTTDSKTQLTSYQQKVSTIRQLLDRMKPQIMLALPKHMNPDRLLRIALTSIAKTPELLECSQAESRGGLSPGRPDRPRARWRARLRLPGAVRQDGHAHSRLRGLIDLARRSGRIVTIEARIVHAKDKFRYAFGLKPVLEHQPHQSDEAGELIAAYAIAHLKDGGLQWDVMWRREIETIRKRSKMGHSGAWVSDYEEMAKKTVLRRLCKMLPASVELQQAVALDERAESGLPPMDVLDLDGLTATPAPSKLEALTEALQNPDAPSHTFAPPEPTA